MSSKAASQSDKNKDKLSEYVSLVEHEILKAKYDTLKVRYESLSAEHESLIKTLELTENTVETLEKEKREVALASENEVATWENKFGELKKEMAKLTKDIGDMLLPETEIQRHQNSAGLAENLNVNCNIESDEGVIVISDDEEGNPKESNGRGHLNSSKQKPKSFFL